MPLQVQLASSASGRPVPAYRLARVTRLSLRAFTKITDKIGPRIECPVSGKRRRGGGSRVSQVVGQRVLRGVSPIFEMSLVQ